MVDDATFGRTKCGARPERQDALNQNRPLNFGVFPTGTKETRGIPIEILGVTSRPLR